MKPITYIQGDATQPQGEGAKIMAHICNDVGKWGKGFVMAVSRRSPQPEAAYRKWYAERQHNDFGLGAVQFVQIELDLWVANMIGQHNVRVEGGVPPIRYDAVEQALNKLAPKALDLNASVHLPRIGCGLAGGKWEIVEPLIVRSLCERGVEVTVYDWK